MARERRCQRVRRCQTIPRKYFVSSHASPALLHDRGTQLRWQLSQGVIPKAGLAYRDTNKISRSFELQHKPKAAHDHCASKMWDNLLLTMKMLEAADPGAPASSEQKALVFAVAAPMGFPAYFCFPRLLWSACQVWGWQHPQGCLQSPVVAFTSVARWQAFVCLRNHVWCGSSFMCRDTSAAQLQLRPTLGRSWSACCGHPSSWTLLSSLGRTNRQSWLHSANCNLLSFLILNPISLCFLKRLTESLRPAHAFHEPQRKQAATSLRGVQSASFTSSGSVSGPHYKSLSERSPWSLTVALLANIFLFILMSDLQLQTRESVFPCRCT